MEVDFVAEHMMLAIVRVQRFQIDEILGDGEGIVVLLDELVGDENRKEAEREQNSEKCKAVFEAFSTADELEIN